MRRNRRGFLFLGLVFSVVILSLGVIPLVTRINDVSSKSRGTRMRVLATQLAHNMIERVRLEPHSWLRDTLTDDAAGRSFVEFDGLLSPRMVWSQHPNLFTLMAQFRRSLVVTSLRERVIVVEAFVRWEETGRERLVNARMVLTDCDVPGGRPW